MSLLLICSLASISNSVRRQGFLHAGFAFMLLPVALTGSIHGDRGTGWGWWPITADLRYLFCLQLEELVLMSTTLKSLNLANCKKLTRLQLKCPSLTALNLSLCGTLYDHRALFVLEPCLSRVWVPSVACNGLSVLRITEIELVLMIQYNWTLLRAKTPESFR